MSRGGGSLAHKLSSRVWLELVKCRSDIKARGSSMLYLKYDSACVHSFSLLYSLPLAAIYFPNIVDRLSLYFLSLSMGGHQRLLLDHGTRSKLQRPPL